MHSLTLPQGPHQCYALSISLRRQAPSDPVLAGVYIAPRSTLLAVPSASGWAKGTVAVNAAHIAARKPQIFPADLSQGRVAISFLIAALVMQACQHLCTVIQEALRKVSRS